MSQNRRRVADRAITAAAVVTVLVVTGIAAAISYQHCYDLAVRYGETGATARALPLTVDGLIGMCSLVLLDAARRGEQAPRLTWGLLAAGVLATMAANVAHGIEHGRVGAIIAAWPALVAVGSFELLASLIRRGAQVREADGPAGAYSPAGTYSEAGPGTRPEPGAPEYAPVPEAVPGDVPDGVPGAAPESAPAPSGVPDDIPAPVPASASIDEVPQDTRVPDSRAAAPVSVPAPRVPAELLEHAAEVFNDDLADGRVPAIRAIKQQLGVGQTRAREVQAHLRERRARSVPEYAHA